MSKPGISGPSSTHHSDCEGSNVTTGDCVTGSQFFMGFCLIPSICPVGGYSNAGLSLRRL